MNRVNDVSQAIKNAVEETFLNMAFLDAIPSSETEVSPDVSQLIIIDITRPMRGTILLHLPLALKQKIVEIIHADEWEKLNSRQIDDCLLEILNVLAGNFLLALLGENVKYNMTFPQIVFDEQDIPQYKDYEEFFYDAEGIVFGVSVRLES